MRNLAGILIAGVLVAGCTESSLQAGRSSVARHEGGRAYAKVTGLSDEFGNIYTEFVQQDLTALGISPGSHFTVGVGDKSFKVYLGKTYSDVPRGQWVAFLRAEGVLQIARNFENASKTLGCKAGDTILISPLPAK